METGARWYGEFDLEDAETMRVFNEYVWEKMMAITAQFDPTGRAREQSRLLEMVPEPTGPAHEAASRAALIRAGISDETIAIIEEANRTPSMAR